MPGHGLPTEPKVATAGSLVASTVFGQCFPGPTALTGQTKT
jgi:hypothetical protein